MRVTATPICHHEDGWTSSGEPFAGSHLIVGSDGVWIDMVHVIKRDRRAKRNREPGHPWRTNNGSAEYNAIGWTSFHVTVEP